VLGVIRFTWRFVRRAVGIDVGEVDRDSRGIHRLSRFYAPSRGNFGLAGSDSRRGRLGRPCARESGAETAQQRRQPWRRVCTE
jgi:hypothetical protein